MRKWFKAHIKQIFAYCGIAFVLLPLVIIPISAQGVPSYTNIFNSGEPFSELYIGMSTEYREAIYLKTSINDNSNEPNGVQQLYISGQLSIEHPDYPNDPDNTSSMNTYVTESESGGIVCNNYFTTVSDANTLRAITYWENSIVFGGGFVGAVSGLSVRPEDYMYRYKRSYDATVAIDYYNSDTEWVIKYYDFASLEAKEVAIPENSLGTLDDYFFIFPTDILYHSLTIDELYSRLGDDSISMDDFSTLYQAYGSGNRSEALMINLFGETCPSYYIEFGATVSSNLSINYDDFMPKGDFFRGLLDGYRPNMNLYCEADSNLVSYDSLRTFELTTLLNNAPIEPILIPLEWLAQSVGSFLSVELFPHFALGSVLIIVIAFGLVMWWLKVFGGG